MFTRKLSLKENETIQKIIDFVRNKHQTEEGHDYSHVLEVCRLAIEIGSRIQEPVDPFIILGGALLHDIGRVGAPDGRFHGIDGASRAEEFLESMSVDAYAIKRITGIIVRHTPTSMLPPEKVEEKVIYDADTIERMGLMGMVRGIMGKKGSMESIITDRVMKRLRDFDTLFFDVSRELAKPHYETTREIAGILQNALKSRLKEIEEIQSYRLLREV